MKDITLSFIVVTYNHERCIRRCLDSILAQKLRVPYEIIVGDDRSSDGTWQILEEYKENYPEIFTIYRVNSDDCHPLSLSDRASYNRGHAYGLIKGKYYAEIDGDDFLLPGDTYQQQVDMLEKHLECWLCKQEMLVIHDGESIDKAKPYHPIGTYADGQIISAEEYLSNSDLFAQHQSFVFRRNKENNPIEKLGLDYEDTTVTLFHLQYGPMICIDKAAYVYVSHSDGINQLLMDDDRLVNLALLQVEHMLYYPQFAKWILRGSMKELIHLFKETTTRKLKMSDNGKKPLRRYDGLLFDYYKTNNPSVLAKMRIRYLRIIILLHAKYAWFSEDYICKKLTA